MLASILRMMATIKTVKTRNVYHYLVRWTLFDLGLKRRTPQMIRCSIRLLGSSLEKSGMMKKFGKTQDLPQVTASITITFPLHSQ